MNINPTNKTIELLHRIAAHPWVYDGIQALAGQPRILELISEKTVNMLAETVVDVGGGTGASRKLWPPNCRYVCLDIELAKLKRFRAKVPGGFAVLSDAGRMSIATASADVVLCMAVIHHLSDVVFEELIDEAYRVLKIHGQLILLDPVLNRERWMGRALWKLDRGSYPRTAEELRKKLEGKFKIIHWQKHAIFHEYVFGIGARG